MCSASLFWKLWNFRGRKILFNFLILSPTVEIQRECKVLQCRRVVFHLLFRLPSTWHGFNSHVLQSYAGMLYVWVNLKRKNLFDVSQQRNRIFLSYLTSLSNWKTCPKFISFYSQEQVIYKLTNLKKCASQCFKCRR